MRTMFSLLLIIALFTLLEMPVEAQQPTKVPRVGFLGGAYPRSLIFKSFQQGLRELGYIEGQNIVVIHRPSYGDASEFPDFAADLVRLKVDVIVAQSGRTIRAAMNATKTIPIVMTFVGDPVLLGFVAGLERPGGNVTGVSGLTTELGGKWLELLKETIPSAKRVEVFWNWRAEATFQTWKSLEIAARSLQVDLEWLEVRFPRDIERTFRRATWGKADAFIVLPGYNIDYLREIASRGLKNRLPGIFWRTDLDLGEVGGLMAYGANRVEQSRRAAYVVDKILRGAKPAELPVELPKSFELIINLKTAKEIGITVPPRVLAWADRVIR